MLRQTLTRGNPNRPPKEDYSTSVPAVASDNLSESDRWGSLSDTGCDVS
jgi:hypothetical protein